MEVESSNSKRAKLVQEVESEKQRKRRFKCLGITAAIIITIVLLIVILALTVFKAKRPVITINSMSLEDLNTSMDILRLRVNLNLSLNVDLSVKNPNKVGFRYTNSSALLNYRGQQVGDVPIPGGEISAGETKPMNVTLTLMADRLLSDSQVYSDVMSGVLPLNTFTRISGKVSIFNIFKVHVVSSSSCDFNVFVSNTTVGDQKCKYHTKF